jgi:rhamnosyltransferase subunit B
MARIVITTFGSAGDVNPFMALGLGLRERGHEVTFAVEERFRVMFEDAGFKVGILTGDAYEFFNRNAAKLIGSNNEAESTKLIFLDYQVPLAPVRTRELLEICRDADLLVTSVFHLAAANVEDTLQIPVLTVSLTPSSFQSDSLTLRDFGKVPAPLKRILNRTLWKIARLFSQTSIDPAVNKMRAELGLPSRRHWLFENGMSRTNVALAVSPLFTPRPADWPAKVKMTGYLQWDKPANWSPSPELNAFFADGKPVVALSFGSMAPDVRNEFTTLYRMSIEAVLNAGAKALVIGAAADVLPNPLPANALALDFAPFSEIYPRCAAVIHHGGMGTAAQSLRAGVPTLVVPWGFDQFFTGSQLQNIGVGLSIKRKKYNVQNGVAAIKALLSEPQYRETAQSVARQLAKEDGVASLSDHIETILGKTATATKM